MFGISLLMEWLVSAVLRFSLKNCLWGIWISDSQRFMELLEPFNGPIEIVFLAIFRQKMQYFGRWQLPNHGFQKRQKALLLEEGDPGAVEITDQSN
jgi:hypothetical protein